MLTVSTDPPYPPQSSLNEQTGEYEGFDIDVATEIANRLGVDVAWETPAVGRHHRRQLERPLGHHRGLDDADQRPAGGPLLHRALQLHAGRRRGPGPTTIGHRPHHRPRRQEDRRLQRLHLRAVPRQGASTSRATSSTSSSTTPRSPATTPTRPRSRTSPSYGRARRGDHSLHHRPGLHRRGQPGEDRGRPGLLRAALGGLRQELGPVVGEPLRGGGRDRRRRCTRTAR